MFWQKPFILLGLLASVSSTAPTLPKRVDIDTLNEEFVFFRADSRGPDEIKKAGRFETKAETNKLTENLSLWDHCKEKDSEDGYGNLDDDGYVSTSMGIDVCVKWVLRYIADPSSTIYKIASDRNLIGCHDTLKHHNPFPSEQEYAAIHGVPWDQVMGWYNQFNVRGKTITDAVFTENPAFDSVKYNRLPDGSDESNNGENYKLAGWPENDKRWLEEPWKNAKNPVCGKSDNPKKGKKKNSRRDIEDLEEDEFVQLVARDLELLTRGREDMHLFARARGSKVPSKKPIKKPTKGPATKPTKKPVATPTKECTVAMEKSGKCTARCSAVEKKKNGGECPKNVCGMPTPNKQLAKQYLQLFETGKLGKSGKSRPGNKNTAKKPKLM